MSLYAATAPVTVRDSAAMGVRVVIAEDSPIVRSGLASLLRAAGVDVVAETGDAQSLMLAIARTGPDAAIVDVRMPPSQTDEGIAAAHAIRAKFPSVGVLLLSQDSGSPALLDLVEHCRGGIGYLLKDRVADAEVLIDAVKRIMDGETVVDSEVIDRLIEARLHAAMITSSTPREHQVLALMAQGKSNAAIARALVISPKTVELHINRVLKLLDLPVEADANRRVLAVLAYLRASGRIVA